MIGTPSPGKKKKSIRLERKIKKEVEIRLDQSLVYIKFSKYHMPTV